MTTQTVAEILQTMGDSYSELKRLEAIEALVKAHPEWVKQEPKLLPLIKSAA